MRRRGVPLALLPGQSGPAGSAEIAGRSPTV